MSHYKTSKLRLILFSLKERLTGVMALIIFLTLLTYTKTHYELSCQYKGSSYMSGCIIKTSSLSIFKKNITIGRLYSASSAPQFSFDGESGLLYQIVLETSQGKIPLLEMPGFSLNKKETIIDKVNDFIHQGENLTLLINHTEPVFFEYLLLFLIFFSLHQIFKFGVAVIKIDKPNNSMRLTIYALLSLKRKSIDLDLIKYCDIHYIVDKRGRRLYRLAIMLKNGERIFLDDGFHFFVGEKKKLADKINQFLRIAPRPNQGIKPAFTSINIYHLLLWLLVAGFLIGTYFSG